MKSKKRLLKESLLYLILDRPGLVGFSLRRISSLVAGKEIGLIQLRDKFSPKVDVLKFAIKLAKQADLTKTLFIVNDYVDVAVAASADGVHLGQEDLPLKQARKLLGRDKIIGISCHSLRQALQAQKEGADYIGIGPIYTTVTKPGYRAIGLRTLRQLKNKIKIPYFAIGSIQESNVDKIIASGASRIAVCRAILKAADPKRTVKRLYKKLVKL